VTNVSEFAVDGPVRLRLSVPAGRIDVRHGDDDRVEIELVPLRNDDTTLTALDRARVEAVQRGGHHEIRVAIPKREGGLLSLGRQPSIAVEARCPAGCDIDIDSSSTDVDLSADCGTVTMKTASGDLTAARVAALSVTSASGDVEVDAVERDLSVKTASGDIDARGVGGIVAVNSVSGDVHLGRADGTVTIGTVSGDAAIDALSGGGLRANAVSGDIVVGVAQGLRLWIDAQSVSGSMRSDLELGEGAGGEGDTVELRIRTVSGDVHIRRA
jgi:DUF4097 and DUF4098 domain-containing protein YvlB